MNMTITNQKILQQESPRQINKQTITYYGIYTMLVLGSTIHFAFSLLNFAFCLYLVFRKTSRFIVPFFVYATFFASLFKVKELTTTSLLTIVIMLYVLKQLVQREKVRKKFFILFFLLAAGVIFPQLISGEFDIARNIKFFETYIYLYLIISIQGDKDAFSYQDVLRALIFGVLISSVFRMLDGNLFRVSEFVTEKSLEFEEENQNLRRFSGLYGDPNYYAVNVILAMNATIFLYCKQNLSAGFTYGLLVVFVIFSVLTRSKSALLMLFVPAILLYFANRKRKKHWLQIIYIAALIVVVVLAYSGKITWFSSITERFAQSEDMKTLTSGRVSLWNKYLQYFNANPMKTIFGSGLSAPVLELAAHNTYIDIVYHLGIIPGAVYIGMVVYLIRMKRNRFKRNIMNYSPLLIILPMYFFLSCLFDLDLCTNILTTAVLYNTPVEFNKLKKGGNNG